MRVQHPGVRPPRDRDHGLSRRRRVSELDRQSGRTGLRVLPGRCSGRCRGRRHAPRTQKHLARVAQRDGMERRRRKRRVTGRARCQRRWLQRRVQRPALAGERQRLVLGRLRDAPGVRRRVRRRGPVHRGRRPLLAPGMRIRIRRRIRRSQERPALVHDRRHEPFLAACRVGLRARRRRRWCRIPSRDALPEREAAAGLAARHQRLRQNRLQRQMFTALRRRTGVDSLHARTGGRSQLLAAAHLSGPQRLRRPDGGRNSAWPGGVQTPLHRRAQPTGRNRSQRTRRSQSRGRSQTRGRSAGRSRSQ